MIHDPDCQCDTYGCQLRQKGLQVTPSSMPNRHNRVAKQTQPSAHNKQIRGEKRPGGFLMPYINPDGTPVRAKQFESQHAAIKDNVARTRAHHAQRAEGQ